MTLPKLFVGAAGVAAGAVLLCNVAPWMVAKPQLATIDYLAAAKLKTLDEKRKKIMEAQGLSSLLPEMESRGVRLHALVHEALGVEEFKPFFKGDVFFDPQRHFYGPQERWMNIPGLFSFESIAKFIANRNTPGDMKGEGRLLGAVFVIGPGDQGILYQHHEKVVGDAADLEQVKDAIMKVDMPTE